MLACMRMLQMMFQLAHLRQFALPARRDLWVTRRDLVSALKDNKLMRKLAHLPGACSKHDRVKG